MEWDAAAGSRVATTKVDSAADAVSAVAVSAAAISAVEWAAWVAAWAVEALVAVAGAAEVGEEVATEVSIKALAAAECKGCRVVHPKRRQPSRHPPVPRSSPASANR